MSFIFNEFFYRPLFNFLVLIYEISPIKDLGLAIIFLTIFIRLILFPIFYKGAKDQAMMQQISPKIKEIQKTHKHDKEKQTRALLELYREHKINPLSGFLLLLVQLPILIALYNVFLSRISADSLSALYDFVPAPTQINHFFLGFIDLSLVSFPIVFLAAVAQYYQAKLALNKTNQDPKSLTQSEIMTRQMVYLGPVLTIVFLYFFKLPSAIGLYWLTTSLFSVIQQIIINKDISRALEEKKHA